MTLFSDIKRNLEDWLWRNVDQLIERGVRLVKYVYNTVYDYGTYIFKTVYDYSTKIFQTVHEYVTNVYQTVHEFVTNVYTTVYKTFNTFVSNTYRYVTNIIGLTAQDVRDLINRLFPSSFIKDPRGYIRACLPEILRIPGDFLKAPREYIRTTVPEILAIPSEFLKDPTGYVVDKIILPWVQRWLMLTETWVKLIWPALEAYLDKTTAEWYERQKIETSKS